MSILVFHFMLGTSILIAPSNMAFVAKQDGWLASILGIALMMVTVFLYDSLMNRYPKKTLIEIIEIVLGKWIGKVIGLVMFGYLFLLTSFLVRVAGSFITTQVMPETPIEVVHIVLAIIVMIAVGYGIETIARAAELLFMPVLFLFVLLVIFLMPDIHFDNLLPIMERGPKPIALAAFNLFTIQEVLVFLMLYTNLSKPNKFRRTMLAGVTIGGGAIILTVTLCILVLGSDLTERNIFASYSLAKKISVAKFLRVDAFMAIIWLIALFFKTAISFYGAAVALKQTLSLHRYKVLILPLGFLMLWLSIIVYSSIVEFLNFTPAIWSLYSVCHVVLLPILLIVIDRIRFGNTPGGKAKLQSVPPSGGTAADPNRNANASPNGNGSGSAVISAPNE